MTEESKTPKFDKLPEADRVVFNSFIEIISKYAFDTYLQYGNGEQMSRPLSNLQVWQDEQREEFAKLPKKSRDSALESYKQKLDRGQDYLDELDKIKSSKCDYQDKIGDILSELDVPELEKGKLAKVLQFSRSGSVPPKDNGQRR